MESPSPPVSERSRRLRRVANLVNLSTPLGLVVATVARCRLDVAPYGIHLASGYRWPFPLAGAFTVGNVLIARGDWANASADLRDHEEAHTWQWAALGPFFLPAYVVAMGWSWLRVRDRAGANWFEVRAGLAKGGYRIPSPRKNR